MATRYDPLSGRVITTPDASSGVAGVDAAIAAAAKKPVPTDPAKLAQFNVGQSAPIVEKGVSVVYGTMAKGFDLGIQGVKTVAKGMSKRRHSKKGGRKGKRHTRRR